MFWLKIDGISTNNYLAEVLAFKEVDACICDVMGALKKKSKRVNFNSEIILDETRPTDNDSG